MKWTVWTVECVGREVKGLVSWEKIREGEEEEDGRRRGGAAAEA